MARDKLIARTDEILCKRPFLDRNVVELRSSSYSTVNIKYAPAYISGEASFRVNIETYDKEYWTRDDLVELANYLLAVAKTGEI